jgi:hypothetical protein
MVKTYSAPTLTRYGAFGELTQGQAGKSQFGGDTHPVFQASGQCNPHAQGVPGSCGGDPPLS